MATRSLALEAAMNASTWARASSGAQAPEAALTCALGDGCEMGELVHVTRSIAASTARP